jgi:hypothetical protein
MALTYKCGKEVTLKWQGKGKRDEDTKEIITDYFFQAVFTTTYMI